MKSFPKQARGLCCIALTLYACGSAAAPAGRIEYSSTTPTTAPSPSPTPLATAPRSARATWGDAARASEIVSHLRASGLRVDPRDVPPGTPTVALFGAEKTELLRVENERLTLFSFATADQAESVFQLVSQRRDTVTWDATPYFVKIGSTLAVLTTMDETVARRVVEALIR
jgi:hypothetical protein